MIDLLIKAREHVWLEGNPDRDHSTGLLVFGVLEIILGILSFSAAMFLMILVSETGLAGMKTSHFWVVMGLLFYLTGWFAMIGLGSIRAARWARVLALVGSWAAVFFGTLAMALLLYILPGAYELLLESSALSPASAMTALYVAISMLFFLQLVLPMGTIAFYGLQGVRTTCERKNSSPCWSDGYPLPLLAMGFVSVSGCLTVVFGATTNYAVFLFGYVWTGWKGFIVVFAAAVACGYIGWGVFMRRMHAWWMAYAIIVLIAASMMLTFSELDMATLFRAMNYAPASVDTLASMRLISPAVLTFVVCIWGIMACIYLVWVRGCFQPEIEPAEIKSYRQRKAEEEPDMPPEPDSPRMRLD